MEDKAPFGRYGDAGLNWPGKEYTRCRNRIPAEILSSFHKKFHSSEKNLLAQNVCTTQPMVDVLRNRRVIQNTNHCFNIKVGSEGKPVTDQKGSGRCWIFACLNLMRIPFMKAFELEEFEFSQTYLFFWDKVERANYLLNAFIECARKGEDYSGRLVHHLLTNPCEDGGQWDMLVNLVEKYGVVPKSSYPEAWSSENSGRLGGLICNRMREFCMRLHKMVSEGRTEEDIQTEKQTMVEEIYRIMCITLGTPPEKMNFQCYDKTGKYHSSGEGTPVDFYRNCVKPVFNIEDFVCVVNDPRSTSPYNQLYTVEYLGNMTGGRPVLYINKPVEVLKKLVLKSLTENDQPVWFGCDVGKCFVGKEGIQDLNVLNYKLTFDLDTLRMNKAERLMYAESLMTHAMVITGANVEPPPEDKDGQEMKPQKWRIQNSWGDKDGDKGYLVMTDDWFSEFVYEVVVHRDLLDEDTQMILEQDPIVLPAWDPMGALARA